MLSQLVMIEFVPELPLFQVRIVTDKLQQIPLRVGEVHGVNMDPLVNGRIHLQPQTLETFFLRFEIFESYIECNMVQCRLV